MLKGRFAQEPLYSQLLLLVGLVFVGMLFFTTLGVLIASATFGISPEDVLNIFQNLDKGAGREVFKLVQSINTIGSYFIPALVAAYLFDLQPKRFIGSESFPMPAWLIIANLVLMAYSMSALSDLLYRLSASFPWPESFTANMEDMQEVMMGTYSNILNMQGFGDFLHVLMVMAVLPAIAEESLFRGVLQPLLRRKLNPHIAILITSFAFSALHQQYLAFLSIFVLGMLLGYLREWTNSIWPSTILHFFNNASIVVLVYFFDYDYSEALSENQGINWAETGTLLAVLIFSVLLFERLSRRSRDWSDSK